MKKTIMLLTSLAFSLIALTAVAQETATLQEVYDKCIAASSTLEQLGPEALPAFDDPKGEFVWKDSYVFVFDCKKDAILAHPAQKMIGVKMSQVQDKPGDIRAPKHHGQEMCKAAQSPTGEWVAYYWEKLGSDKPERKVSFVVGVPGKDYVVSAGIYDSTTDIEALNKGLKVK